MRARRCVRTHTHRLHVWQVTRCMEHGSCLFEHGFYLLEHLFYFLRTRILFFLNTNFTLTDYFNAMEDWRDEKNIYKPNFFVENRWYFYAQKWIFMQNKRRKWINIQNSGCKQNQGFYFLFSKISRVLFIVFVNNS